MAALPEPEPLVVVVTATVSPVLVADVPITLVAPSKPSRSRSIASSSKLSPLCSSNRRSILLATVTASLTVKLVCDATATTVNVPSVLIPVSLKASDIAAEAPGLTVIF